MSTLLPCTVPPVLEPIEFQNDVVVVRGSPVVLPCEARGSPLPLVSWMKNGEPLLPQSLEQGPGLQLETVGAGDSGTYSCVAVSEAGEARRHFQLTVMGGSPAPSPSFSAPGTGGRASVGNREALSRVSTPGGLGLREQASLAWLLGLRRQAASFSWDWAPQSCPPNLVKQEHSP